MKYLHTMIRVSNIDETLRFFCEGLGLEETRRKESEKGRYTLIFLAAPNDKNAEINNRIADCIVTAKLKLFWNKAKRP